MSDFGSSRINHGAAKRPPHICPQGRRWHIPLRVGERVCVWGGHRNEWADACCSHISTRPRREAPTGILRMNKINGGSSENEPLVRDASGIQESRVLGVCGRHRETGGWVGHLQRAGTATLGPEVWKLQETRDAPLSR